MSISNSLMTFIMKEETNWYALSEWSVSLHYFFNQAEILTFFVKSSRYKIIIFKSCLAFPYHLRIVHCPKNSTPAVWSPLIIYLLILFPYWKLKRQVKHFKRQLEYFEKLGSAYHFVCPLSLQKFALRVTRKLIEILFYEKKMEEVLETFGGKKR